ncbi:transcription factor jun-B-like isoform X1 [Pundamilia nyererei]|uniref:JunB proto-oncogene, AP-1 transcription factor subunit a n=3 Tax=Haplochromini TaxID=319058 RepID=A0A3Q2WD34_HAPBU|nr:PREDICTED: transcription factor jun-B-like isoform X1 [Pundamilia nyererei]XP_005924981.1 transcription factor jun-B-like isoform X1 [Haplochromis burtoni]XP_005946239.1 transcription factor jun-B-like isoform X1 [Haplochromis burtoni]
MSTIMEQPFYDDSFLSAYGHPGAALQDYKLLKQNMNLNFSDTYRNSNFKSQHLRADSDFYPAGTAEVGSLKLASPELERLIVQSSNGVITTPTPAQYLYNRGITEEQEGFAEGFVKALDDLHKMNQMAPPNVSIGTGGVGCSAPVSVFGSSMQPEPLEYTTLSSCTTNPSLTSAASYPSTTISYLPHHQYHQHPQAVAHGSHHFQHSLAGAGIHPQRFGGMKEEPQTVPDMQSSDNSSPPMSPIDMENQERVKAERKRLRNRLAASKCRRRKLERIARLEDKVKVLKNDNAGLSSTASLLREQVAQLKQKVMTHVSSGCQLMLAPKVKSY